MSRNGSGVYSLPGTYAAVSGATIEAQQHNDPLEDLQSDANTARPIVAGGTAATTAAAARTNLGVYSTTEVDAAIAVPIGTARIDDVAVTAAKIANTAISSLKIGSSALGSGFLLNGSIVESHTSSAVTFALKTLAGADPSATDPVIACFRNVTAGTGDYVYRSITAATSLTIPSGATMGASSGGTAATAFKIWLGLLDNAGTAEIFAINCLSGVNVYPLGQFPVVTTTTVSTSADNAHIPYSTTGRTSVPYLIIGYAAYEAGITTAGTWAASPTRLHLQSPNDPLPGSRIQQFRSLLTTFDSGSTSVPLDDTIPQITEGNEYITQAITPTSAANVMQIEAMLNAMLATSGETLIASIFNTDFHSTNAMATVAACSFIGARFLPIVVDHLQQAGTGSSTTYRIRMGSSDGNKHSVNSDAGQTSRVFADAASTWLRVTEIMA